ncbi:hypothetical protein CAPN008_06030 [Capnocytophaga canis]|uniref:hypothetical protein n=1 Tax=Capnocytophaga canis TaxID=1848903 RepID=UPI001ACBCB39|nr:hypothetical protein [Capnocytophaga canis]GIM60553.1 hypothetical protein CAPN008_06030 [Capnocytophaga canis]
MKLTAINIEERQTRYEKRTDIFQNGIDNAYPTLVERLVNASPTAMTCAGLVAKFISCKGFIFEEESRLNAKNSGIRFHKGIYEVNRKGDTPSRLLKKVAQSIAMHRGCFVHVNYNALYQKTSLQLLPYKWCRLGKEDSEGYKGKIIVYDNWDLTKRGGIKKADFEIFDIYNPDPKVIQAQVEKSGGWQFYKGQIYFLNLDHNDTYPLPYADSVLLDCESERQSAIFINNGFKKSFFGKHALFTQPFESDRERDDFKEELKKSFGVESTETILHFEKTLTSESFKDEFLLEKIESNINDKTFEYTDKKIARNIRVAFGNIPPVLIDMVEGKLGNTSGESLVEAQHFMQLQTEDERSEIEDMFEELCNNFHKPLSPNGLYQIKLFIENSEETRDKDKG